jgi:thymidylate synthase
MAKFQHGDLAYRYIVEEVLRSGTRKENRTGVDTLSTLGVHYNLDLAYGFPLLTTKKISWKNIVVEMLWFLSGQTDIAILKRHNCGFWDSWTDEEGKVPSAYGAYWRNFPVHGDADGFGHRELGFNDQMAWVLAEMTKNPMSRRLVVSAWAPGNAQTSKLPPCHCLFMFNVQNAHVDEGIVHYGTNDGSDPACAAPRYSPNIALPSGLRGRQRWCDACVVRLGQWGSTLKQPDNLDTSDPRRLCLHLTQRSCDVALGVPYNIASYALLMHIASRISGIPVGTFSHTLVDAHLYTKKPDGSMEEYDHVPGVTDQVKRSHRDMPTLVIDPSIRTLADIEALMAPEVSTAHILEMFKLEGYDPHPAIPFKVAV